MNYNQKQLDFDVIDQKTFVDIPASLPEIRIQIPKVGVSNRPVSLQLKHPLSDVVTAMHTELTVSCSLKSDQRGIHMSRIEECMDELRGAGLSHASFAAGLANLVLKTQQQSSCQITMDSMVENTISKNASGKPSNEILTLHSIAEVLDGEEVLTRGVTVPFMNACPCTQRWAMRDFYNVLKGEGLEDAKAQDIIKKAPYQAHTNGGLATLMVTDAGIDHEDLYAVLDQSVPIIREMLKGIDEHTFVRYTHEQGQFCEDNIRTIAKCTAEQLQGKVSSEAKIHIKVEVNESVHFHNLQAEMETTMESLLAELS